MILVIRIDSLAGTSQLSFCQLHDSLCQKLNIDALSTCKAICNVLDSSEQSQIFTI